MSLFLARYRKREEMRLDCEIIVPMFLGNADQDAEWRAPPFKALLRYWWRVGEQTSPSYRGNNAPELFVEESGVFGAAADGDGLSSSKSLVSVVLCGEAKPSRAHLPMVPKLNHPEVKDKRGVVRPVNPLQYLAGMGLIKPGKAPQHTYFPAGVHFTWTIGLPISVRDSLDKCLALVTAFGTLGSRCRNGWGSFQFKKLPLDRERAANLLNACTVPWEQGFNKDYPNCLGRDAKGPLLWRTEPRDRWEEVMTDLADAYIGVRARTVNGIAALHPDGTNLPDERHLLGFPLTHHPADKQKNWGNQGRHASPLRFVVRRKGNRFRGFVLHLPHKHRTAMSLPNHVRQLDVWEKVHKKLDHLPLLLTRAEYEDCL